MMGYQDCSRLLVVMGDQVLTAAGISLEILLSFGSVLLLGRRGNISPLSLARERESGHLVDSRFLNLSPPT